MAYDEEQSRVLFNNQDMNFSEGYHKLLATNETINLGTTKIVAKFKRF